MNRYMVMLALLVCSLHVSAQKNNPVQHAVFIGLGISMAPEDLAGIESADNKGYVRNGPVGTLSYLAGIRKYIGVGATLGHSRNDLNAAAVARAFSSATTVETEPYALTYLMADVYGMYPVKQWQFYAKGSLGSMLPDLWEMEIRNDIATGTVRSGRTFVPAYAGALGLNYSLGKVTIGLESCLLASEPEFEIELNNVTTYRKQWLSAFNHMLKTGYRF
ncbi:hypothetical protein H7F15_02770 [Pontibacter sp. Tf4]|uniref:hypothetical protein n=1 Tax=Pontibacter sp. Tf4 TaxID=2761620 RepID=UPI001629313A|nr:hypothetical protein [Pontibacter sp. Tf4]MBB6609948.1 hypothetical protein [Pontibacter sp. Tf4]